MGGRFPAGHAERDGHARALLVVALGVLTAERRNEAVVHAERGVDQRRVHPQQGLGVEGAVRPAVGTQAADGAVDGIDPADGRLGFGAAAEDHREAALQCPEQPAERIGRVRRVLRDPGRDGWVRSLEQQRARSSGEDEQLAVDPPRDRGRPEQPGSLVGGGGRHR